MKNKKENGKKNYLMMLNDILINSNLDGQLIFVCAAFNRYIFSHVQKSRLVTFDQ